MDSYVFQCDVPHQWIAQRHVGPVYVYCDGVSVMSCVCGKAFLCGMTFCQSTIATSRQCRDVTRLRCLKATLKPNNIYTIPFCEITPIAPKSDLSIGLSSGVKIHTCMYRQNPAQGSVFYDVANLFSQIISIV